MSRFKSLFYFLFSKKFIKNIGLIALTYLIVISVLVYYLGSYTKHGQKVEVPNLIGKNISNIKSILEGLNLEYEVAEVKYDPRKVKGTILDQDPASTEISNLFVKEGRIIRLKISKAIDLVDMPDLVSKSERFALQVLKNRGLKYEIEYKKSNESDGAVLDQRYKGKSVRTGYKLPIGSVVTLIVGKSQGGEPVQIPDLYGFTIAEAESLIDQIEGISLFGVCPECLTYEDSVKARIESQAPDFVKDLLAPFGTTITVYANPNFKEEIEGDE